MTSSLASLLSETVATSGEHAALAHGDARFTYAQLDAAVDRLASALAVDPGEAVAVVAPNVPALVVGLFAVWRASAVAVPLSARLRRFELARAFADSQPAVAVSVAAHAGFAIADEIEALAEDTPSLRARIVVDELGAVEHRSSSRTQERSFPLPEELAAIMYTSGTTGEPKGALVSHALAEAAARNLAAVLAEDADAPYGLVVPASHVFGLGCLLCGVVGGALAVLVDASATLEPLVRALRANDARILHGTPALFGRALRARADIGLRGGFTAGSSCPAEVLQALDEQGARVLNAYGMTEIGAATSCRHEDPPEIRHHTVGRALPGYELRVAPGEPGEIQVRCDWLPCGYHRRPWGEQELTADGWFRTGDLGRLDAAGNLTISGRAKEVVHVGGFNVFPAEVESFLLTHPAIAQAAVIGVPHPVLGETLEAFVVAAGNTVLAPREVIAFARAGIAGYKVPYAVQVLDELPLLSSGKPDRRALAGRAGRAGTGDGEQAGGEAEAPAGGGS
ncbi:MAG TPA: class I adenylate-forming enzyme family protein [Solirubrobacteraceae bacterium]|nr:class I adenylate-forming enzyme family protein [Solirubrobacteraceae bacterium]